MESTDAIHVGHGERPPAGLEQPLQIVAGNSFLICSSTGDLLPGRDQGYFAGDTRMLSELVITVDGQPPRPLSHAVRDRSLHAAGVIGDPTRPTLLVEREMAITDVLTLNLRVENLENAPRECAVDVLLRSDFADVFDVKRGVVPRWGFVGGGPFDGHLRMTYEHMGFRRCLTVTTEPAASFLRDGLRAVVSLERRGVWEMQLVMTPEDAPGVPMASVGLRPMSSPTWVNDVPTLKCSEAVWARAWKRSCDDISSLLLEDPARPGRPIVAAGSPWFMALFGRDSLITSMSALPLGATLALGALGALADRQGKETVVETAEQPGRILHEVRGGETVQRPGGWGSVYYGSVDATPLFVMALREAWRWGARSAEIEALLPAAERAVEWMLGPADVSGLGFIGYSSVGAPGTASLDNQGWKDSDDAIRHPDGSIAEGPVSPVEVQGYFHAALLALAELREWFGTGDPAPLRARADQLQRDIDEHYWMPKEDCYALAVAKGGAQVASVSTNAGHLLWTRTAPPERALAMAARLMADDMFTGAGLRTLSSSNPAFNALSYHCGSVWPHDTAIVAAGMLRSGAIPEGLRLARGLLETTDDFAARLPELFAGTDTETPGGRRAPLPYPTSCSPQAWAAAAPVQLLTAMLGIEPDVPRGVVRIEPCFDTHVELEIVGLALGDATLDVVVRGSNVAIAAAPDRLQVLVDEPGHAPEQGK